MVQFRHQWPLSWSVKQQQQAGGWVLKYKKILAGKLALWLAAESCQPQ